MAKPESTYQRSFTGGELAPALYARADMVRYVSGLKTCRNFIVQRHGGVANRPGTRFVLACKSNASSVALMRYVSENVGESVLLEIGNGYLRFFVNGAQLGVNPGTVAAYAGGTTYAIGDLVIDGGIVYWARVISTGVTPATDPLTWWPLASNLFDLPSPFATDLPYWSQSGRTLTLTHINRAPWELINGGSLTQWIFRPVATATAQTAPTGLGVAWCAAVGTQKRGYVVTAGAHTSLEESLISGQVIGSGKGQPTPDDPDVLTWAAPTGVAPDEYYVYQDPTGNGIYGFLGTAVGATTFRATKTTPDMLTTPPLARVLFNAAGEYPAVSATFQQRRFFANTKSNPEAVYGSRIGFPSNFGVSSPVLSDDSISFKVAGVNHNPVRHLLAVNDLIVLTDTGEWSITGGTPGSPLIPNGIDGREGAYIGASSARPVTIGNSMVYVQARGKLVRDLQFDLQVEGLGGRDLSIFSTHLFSKFTINEIDFALTPNSVVWCVRSDGALLGLTYVREQDVWGWHRHDTNQNATAGLFEHVCVVPEAGEDVVYVIVKRTINAAVVRYIEKFMPREIVVFNTDAIFPDASLSYSGAPTNNVTGLAHLNGQVVAVVGDGAVIYNGDPAGALAANFTVTGGTFPVVFPASYSNIHVGLRVVYDFEPLDQDVQGSNVRDKEKRIDAVSLVLEASARTFSAGRDVTHLTVFNPQGFDTAVTTPFTGLAELSISSGFDDNGRVFVRHTDPLPLTILGILPNTEVGG